jgi:hypothetical protein
MGGGRGHQDRARRGRLEHRELLLRRDAPVTARVNPLDRSFPKRTFITPLMDHQLVVRRRRPDLAYWNQ